MTLVAFIESRDLVLCRMDWFGRSDCKCYGKLSRYTRVPPRSPLSRLYDTLLYTVCNIGTGPHNNAGSNRSSFAPLNPILVPHLSRRRVQSQRWASPRRRCVRVCTGITDRAAVLAFVAAVSNISNRQLAGTRAETSIQTSVVSSKAMVKPAYPERRSDEPVQLNGVATGV